MDTCNNDLRVLNITTHRWEEIAKDRSQKRQELNMGLLRERTGSINVQIRQEPRGKTVSFCSERERQTSCAASATETINLEWVSTSSVDSVTETEKSRSNDMSPHSHVLVYTL